jgi:magnesium-transporting ATPase (P-type)
MDLGSFNIWVSSVSDITALLPVILCVFFVPRQQPYTWLSWYFYLSGFIMIITLITSEMGIFNMPAYHLLAAVEVILLYAFYAVITHSNGPRAWVIGTLVVLFILNSFFIEPIDQFNSFAWTFGIIFLLCLGLGYLYKLYDDLENIHLPSHPLFIINTGFLIYFAGSLFTYILGSKILSEEAKGFFHNGWVIQSFSNIVKNTIVGYGLWLARQQ